MLKNCLRWLLDRLIRRPVYLYRCWTAGVSDVWLRKIFGELVQLEVLDWVEVAPDVLINGAGSTLLVKSNDKIWSINQNRAGQMYIHVAGDLHEIEHEGMANVKTVWHEVYRTGLVAKDFEFYKVLKTIVEEGFTDLG